MQTIYNDILTVTINPMGAELSSVFHKEYGLEYMWNADPAFWPKKSPVLFPIVGMLKEHTYYYKDIPYQLGRHGFAREQVFTVSEQSQDAVSFVLESNAHTFSVYPFHFTFTLRYALDRDTLSVTYSVTNKGSEDMYFSVGAHPAFRVPLVEGTRYDQYFLEFDQQEQAGRWPIFGEGLIEEHPEPLLQGTATLPLSKELFYRDALVFKHLSSQRVALRSHETVHGLEMDFAGFPYMGIWAFRDADFVCIEPWCGIADPVSTDQRLPAKEGINRLEAQESFDRTWTITLF